MTLSGPFRKLLVANRGEIAVRVLRTARALGYATVAVTSDADQGAPHVALADEAVRLGPAPARDSYLSGERLLEAAARAGADAIHPGYGFLAENAEFAAACAWAGLRFVGPPAEAIQLMGDKARAKARMLEAGVPCVPGYHGAQDEGSLRAAAEELGYPLLVKAAAGGGGRGMRRVERAADLLAALAAARAEAQSAFGCGDLLLERVVTRARHVEVQVFADAHGGVLHLGERDCSAQRRYQKVVEEAPSPAVDPALRARMGQAAVDAARAIGYVGAGTVELLLGPSGDFYFLEMNTRLQVEHPVTELVTGLDLVAWQLEVAAGKPLPLTQEQVALRGHAIEARLYAEDPYAGHLPQAGRVLAWAPDEGPGLRCDHGLRAGQEVTAFYDPMVGKLVAWGEDREQARRRLGAALRRTVLLGPTSNKAFLGDLLEHERFVQGQVTTDFLDGPEGAALCARPAPSPRLLALAGALFVRGPAPQADHDGWTTTGPLEAPLPLRLGDEELALRVSVTGRDAWAVRVGGEVHPVRVLAPAGEARLRVEVDGLQATAHAAWDGARLHVELDGRGLAVEEVLPRGAQTAAEEGGTLRAPVSGTVIAVHVAVGDAVAAGQVALVLESMKIESRVTCAVAGEVREVRARVGEQVRQGHPLVLVEARA